MYDNKSVPPVDASAFKIIAVPIPIIIPPQTQAKNLSNVTEPNFSNTFIPNDNSNVPATDLTNKLFLILKNANNNSGIFRKIITFPAGTFHK